MKQIGKIWALVALAAAGHHFEAGAEIKGKGIDEEEKRKLLRQRQATEEEPKELVAQLKERRRAADVAVREEEAERQAEIEDTIRPAVEKIVGELVGKGGGKPGASAKVDDAAVEAAVERIFAKRLKEAEPAELVQGEPIEEIVQRAVDAALARHEAPEAAAPAAD